LRKTAACRGTENDGGKLAQSAPRSRGSRRNSQRIRTRPADSR
jgi:hypothetical protein